MPQVPQPFGEVFVQDACERNGQPLRNLRVGEPLGGVEVPRRAYLAGAALRRRRRLLRRAILTGSFSNAIDSTTRTRTTFR
jgi:predicted nucleic acid-binding Zn ribbon protein